LADFLYEAYFRIDKAFFFKDKKRGAGTHVPAPPQVRIVDNLSFISYANMEFKEFKEFRTIPDFP